MLGSLLLQACKMRGITLAKACELANIKYSTLHSQISNLRPIPFDTIDKFCAALNLPIRLFSQAKLSITIQPISSRSALPNLTSAQVSEIAGLSNEIGTDDVLDWLLIHDNRLVDHEWLLDRVDLFHPVRPRDTALRPHKIGTESLATKFFRLSNNTDYNSAMRDFEGEALGEIINAHIEAATKRYVVSEQSIDQLIGGTRISGTYRRLIAPVTDLNNQKFTLVFSKLTQFTRR